MKISWVPSNDETIMESRVRVYQTNYQINTFFKEKGYSSVIGFDPTANVIIIQKDLDKQTLDRLTSYKGTVIFDLVEDVFDKPNISAVLKQCDTVLTNNVNRRQQLSEKKYSNSCTLWEDGLDYGINGITLPKNNNRNDVVWFGSNIQNFESVKPIFNILKEDKKLTLSVITSPYYDVWDDQSKYHFDFYQWSLKTFIDHMLQFNISVLSHNGSESLYKSPSKLLTSIALGLPAIVNHSFSYELILKKFGLQDYILTKPENINNLITEISSYENKMEYLKEIQPYVLYKYNMYETTKNLIKILKQI